MWEHRCIKEITETSPWRFQTFRLFEVTRSSLSRALGAGQDIMTGLQFLSVTVSTCELKSPWCGQTTKSEQLTDKTSDSVSVWSKDFKLERRKLFIYHGTHSNCRYCSSTPPQWWSPVCFNMYCEPDTRLIGKLIVSLTFNTNMLFWRLWSHAAHVVYFYTTMNRELQWWRVSVANSS